MFINTRGKSEKSQTGLKIYMNKSSVKLFRGKINISRSLDYSTNFYIIILIAFALVFASYSSSIFSGIPLNTKVEFSFDFFLNSNKNFTRYDEIIDFDSDWKLEFWNELRFN